LRHRDSQVSGLLSASTDARIKTATALNIIEMGRWKLRFKLPPA
jgi:hypothetical protein